MAIIVRMALPADAEVVRRIDEAAFAPLRSIYRPNQAARANLAALVPTLERLVAENTGQIVGTVRFWTSDNRLRVIGLAVLPQCQRQGIARSLIEELVQIARTRGCQALGLYTIVQTGNVPVFQRLGFHTVGEQPDEYSISVSGQPLMEAYMERHVC